MRTFIKFVGLVEANVYKNSPIVSKVKDNLRIGEKTENLLSMWKNGIQGDVIHILPIKKDIRKDVENVNEFIQECGNIYGIDRKEIPFLKVYSGIYDPVMEKNFKYFSSKKENEIPLITYDECKGFKDKF